MMQPTTLYLGDLWHTPAPPALWGAEEQALVTYPRGALGVCADGSIGAVGPAATMIASYPTARRMDFGDAIVLPGFVDAHVHFPQLDMIGAYGERLLGWLSAHTYPEEARYEDTAVATANADRFCHELLANGTTLAAIFGSVHRGAVEALFGSAERCGLRAVIGKASMDRNAPAALLQDAAADLKANEALIQTWHGRAGRLFVALTPRFALSCSSRLMHGLGELRQRYPDVYVQSHHAETQEEVAAVAREFPGSAHYLGVYGDHGLLGPRTVMGHGIHSTDAELAMYRDTHTAVAHCPTSNLFLGSGLFPLRKFGAAQVRVALGSDVGAGTSFSLLTTMGEAYKVQALQGESVSPVRLLYLATLAGAQALGLDQVTGSFAVGKQADFQVLDWRRSRLLTERFNATSKAFERLLPLCYLAGDNIRKAVYIAGREVYGAG